MFNRKKIYYPLILIFALAVYLYSANAFIYYRIGHGNLTVPPRKSLYFMGNREIKPATRYVAIGDSLTYGMGATNYEDAYPYLLADKMSGSKTRIIFQNFSQPGAKTQDLIDRFLTPAISQKPDVVTLLIGVNDIHNHIGQKQFRANYKYILDHLTKETKAKIYLINIPYIGSKSVILPPLNLYFDAETNSYNKIIKELADEYQVKYIDLNSPTKDLFKTDGAHYSADSFHPSSLGYKLWAQIIYDRINN